MGPPLMLKPLPSIVFSHLPGSPGHQAKSARGARFLRDEGRGMEAPLLWRESCWNVSAQQQFV